MADEIVNIEVPAVGHLAESCGPEAVEVMIMKVTPEVHSACIQKSRECYDIEFGINGYI
jgi:hypothetical protein